MPSTMHYLKCANHRNVFAVERAFEDFEEIKRFVEITAEVTVEDIVVQMPDSVKDDIMIEVCYVDNPREIKRTLSQNCDKINEALNKAISGKCDFFAEFRGEIGTGKGCC